MCSKLHPRSCSSLNRAVKQAAAKCSGELNERKCDTATDIMWVVSLFPYLHGREGEEFCSIQRTVRSANKPSSSKLSSNFTNAKQLKVKNFFL